jgi:hypothetical protein
VGKGNDPEDISKRTSLFMPEFFRDVILYARVTCLQACFMTSISEAKMPMTAHIWPRPVIEHREEGSK